MPTTGARLQPFLRERRDSGSSSDLSIVYDRLYSDHYQLTNLEIAQYIQQNRVTVRTMDSSVSAESSGPNPVERAILDAASNAVLDLRNTCTQKGFELSWSDDFLDGVAQGLRSHAQDIATGLNIHKGPSSGQVRCELSGLYHCAGSSASDDPTTGVSNLETMDWLFTQEVSSFPIRFCD